MGKAEKELLARDVAFCETAKQKGHKGWQEFLDKDALMGTKLHEPYVEGWKKISPIMEFIYALEDLDFTWEPIHAFCSKDETLGVTTGMYTRTYTIEGEAFTEKGKYVTTWKKIENTWLVVFDMGN